MVYDYSIYCHEHSEEFPDKHKIVYETPLRRGSGNEGASAAASTTRSCGRSDGRVGESRGQVARVHRGLVVAIPMRQIIYIVLFVEMGFEKQHNFGNY